MILEELILSSFGKFNNKSLTFEKGINIVYGDNEAGKTTVHKFIEGMFFGFFRQYSKRRIYSDDYDKYFPWSQNEYNGVLKYVYDNNIYRIERNFIKGNDDVKIFDEKTGEDISYLFEYDNTTRLHQPSSMHLDLNNTVFNNTISIKQLGTETEDNLAKEVKDSLINLGGSLDEDISIKKVMEKLDKRIDEIGTKSRVKTSLYGKLNDELTKLIAEKEKANSTLNEIKEYQEKLNNTSEDLQKLNDDRENILHNLLILDGYEAKYKYHEAAKLIEEINELNKEMSMLRDNSLTDINQNLLIFEELEGEKNKLLFNNESSNLSFLMNRLEEKQKSLSKFNTLKIVSVILQIAVLISSFIISKSLFFISVFPVSLFSYAIYAMKDNSSYISKLNIEISEIEKRENKKDKKIAELKDNLNSILNEYGCSSKQELRKLANDYSNNLFLLESKRNLLKQIVGDNSIDILMTKAEKYNNIEYKDIAGLDKAKLENKLKEIDDYIITKREELTRLEERVSNLYSASEPLVSLEEEIIRKTKLKEEYESKLASLELAKVTIDRISKNIHRDFAPRLNKEVGMILKDVTGNRYSEVKINETLDIKVVDTMSNKLVDIERLSGGTIDQIYFATRFGIVDIIKGENKLPLILDDCFIQYDENRLNNIMRFLIDQSSSRQILLFTCHTREKKLLDNMNASYNYVQL